MGVTRFWRVASSALMLCGIVEDAVAAGPGDPPPSSDLVQRERQALLGSLAGARLGVSPAFHDAIVTADARNRLKTDAPVLRVVFPLATFFDTDRSDLRADAEPVIAAVAEALRQGAPKLALFVAGHTDSRAGDAYNLRLSVARADAVARALHTLGTGSARLWRIGFGRALPIASNATPDGMARNRRVEFVLSSSPQAAAVWLATSLAAACAGRDDRAADCRQAMALTERFEAVDLDRDGIADVAVGRAAVTMTLADGPPERLDLSSVARRATVELIDPKVTIGPPER